MFSHIIVGVNDLEISRNFYDALLGTLGIKPGVNVHNGIVGRYFYRTPTGSFGITQPLNGEPATHGNGSTIGFTMDSPEQADAFHAAGVANGRSLSTGASYVGSATKPTFRVMSMWSAWEWSSAITRH